VRLAYESSNSGIRHSNMLRFGHTRIMAGINLMTMVQGRMIGYITLQGGYNSVRGKMISTGPNASYELRTGSPGFDYRAGFGLQYYLGPYIAAVAEGGYGGGAYCRTGICYWIR
jgi:hypothetical protein